MRFQRSAARLALPELPTATFLESFLVLNECLSVGGQGARSFGATFQLKALDSVHLATAIEHGCGLFLTNDAKLARCTGITVEVLT